MCVKRLRTYTAEILVVVSFMYAGLHAYGGAGVSGISAAVVQFSKPFVESFGSGFGHIEKASELMRLNDTAEFHDAIVHVHLFLTIGFLVVSMLVLLFPKKFVNKNIMRAPHTLKGKGLFLAFVLLVCWMTGVAGVFVNPVGVGCDSGNFIACNQSHIYPTDIVVIPFPYTLLLLALIMTYRWILYYWK